MPHASGFFFSLTMRSILPCFEENLFMYLLVRCLYIQILLYDIKISYTLFLMPINQCDNPSHHHDTGTLVVNFVLPLEFVTPRWRTFCGCVGFWAVGLMTLAPWAYFIRDWRTLNIAMATTSLVLLPLWWYVTLPSQS